MKQFGNVGTWKRGDRTGRFLSYSLFAEWHCCKPHPSPTRLPGLLANRRFLAHPHHASAATGGSE